QLAELDAEIVKKRQAVEQEAAALDVHLATRQRSFAEEIARMEEQTATAKTGQRHGLRALLAELDAEIATKRGAVEQRGASRPDGPPLRRSLPTWRSKRRRRRPNRRVPNTTCVTCV